MNLYNSIRKNLLLKRQLEKEKTIAENIKRLERQKVKEKAKLGKWIKKDDNTWIFKPKNE